MTLSGTYTFPRGFVWGTATSSHQVEGSNHNNDWSVWEEQPGKILNGDKAGLASGWWSGKWKDDLDRAVETGQNAHRLSIEWSRVQPTPDSWDEDAIEFYRQLLRGMHQRSLMPFVTIHHFTNPIWVTEFGGWENPEVIGWFEAYTRKIVAALKEYCKLWVTINEPNVYWFNGYVLGVFPPGKQDIPAAFKVAVNLVKAHAAAYKAIHELQPAAEVGIAHNAQTIIPERTWLPFDNWGAAIVSRAFNASFPEAIRNGKLSILHRSERVPEAVGTQDYFGLNYYTQTQFRFNPFNAKGLFHELRFEKDDLLSENGFIANKPDGFYSALKWAKSFGLSIYVSENGVEDGKDTMRPRYLVEHLHQLWRAVNYNWPVKGYFHWSLVDNFEWERGWSQRFGLWGLDINTLARIRRKSVDVYQSICQDNAISSQMVQKYVPDSYPVLYPE